MPSPISNFGYILNGYEVTFNNLSLNTDETTTYEWEFGDGTFSSESNPVHIYLGPANYPVKLTVTNNLGLSDITALVNLSGTINPEMGSSISAMIDMYSPTEIIGTIHNNEQKSFLIAKWQTYLQPLIENPEISIQNMYNPYAWPFLVNNLLAKLVVIDIINMESAKLVITTGLAGNPESTTQNKGAVKSIETGPSKVERYDIQNSSENLYNIARALQIITKPGGILDQLTQSACQDADRVNVYLPMCGLKNKVMNFKVAKNKKLSDYNTNPFGITKRMT